MSVLHEHCAAVGRSPEEIEISWAGVTAITESSRQKEEVLERVAKAFGRPAEEVEPGLLIGSVEEIRERISRLVEVGVAHFILVTTAPFHHKMLRRLAEEVIPSFRR